MIVSYLSGARNGYESKVTIVYRKGRFQIAGFTRDWDRMNEGIGGCDINYLTGRGLVSRGLDGPAKPLKVRFAPMTLADWSEDRRPKACGF